LNKKNPLRKKRAVFASVFMILFTDRTLTKHYMPETEKCQELEQAIFAAIAYYDYFNYPLTAAEIYYYLIKEERVTGDRVSFGRPGLLLLGIPKLSEILEIFDNSAILKKTVDQKNGFYFLAGREEIIKQRIQKKKLADQKFKKIRWILRFIAYLPFIRLVMLSGSTGLGNPLKESDIDLLIVVKHGRIWTARAILTFFALVFGAYRQTGRTQNRLCLNHYLTDKSLSVDFGNLYKAEEYLNLLPLAGDLNIYREFFKKNSWMKNYVYSASGSLENNLRARPPKGWPLKIKYFFEFSLSGLIGDYWEKYLKKFQVYFIEKNPLTKSPDARIRYDDNNLVFHPVLIEPEVIKEWKQKMAKFSA